MTGSPNSGKLTRIMFAPRTCDAMASLAVTVVDNAARIASAVGRSGVRIMKVTKTLLHVTVSMMCSGSMPVRAAAKRCL